MRPVSMISYAQNFEDVMLWRALGHVEKGFYIDIGAQDPVVDSVSLAFYEKGWRGIHVEPSSHCAEMLRQARPDDLVIQAAVSSEARVLSFYDVAGGGLSTCDHQIAKKYIADGVNVQEKLVPGVTLDDVFAHRQSEEVHWLKIDVEGAEKQVLQGWRKSGLRPWIVVIESTLPMTQVLSHQKWEKLILRKGYKFAYFDGLNRFYVASNHIELMSSFAVGPNVFDGFGLSGVAWSSWCKVVNHKLDMVKAARETERLEFEHQLQHAQSAIEELKRENLVCSLKIIEQQQNHVVDLDARREETLTLEKARYSEVENLQAEIRRLNALLIDVKQQAGLTVESAHRSALEYARASTDREREVQHMFTAREDRYHQDISSLRDELQGINSLLVNARERFENDLRKAREEADITANALLLAERERNLRWITAERDDRTRLQLVAQAYEQSATRSLKESEERFRAATNRLAVREREFGEQLLEKTNAFATLLLEAQQDQIALENEIASLYENAKQVQNLAEQREQTRIAEASVWEEKATDAEQVRAAFEKEAEERFDQASSATSHFRELFLAEKQRRILLESSLGWKLTKPFRTVAHWLNAPQSTSTIEFTECGSPSEPSAPESSELAAAHHSEVSDQHKVQKVNMPHPASYTGNVIGPYPITLVDMLSLNGEQFVNCAYLTLLKRAPDAGGGATYLKLLASGTAKITILDEIVSSDEGRAMGSSLPGLHAPKQGAAQNLSELTALNGESFVECAYITFLKRSPDSDGAKYYLAHLLQGTSKLQILDEICTSEEAKRNGVVIPGLQEAILIDRREHRSFGGLFGMRHSQAAPEKSLRALEQQMLRFFQQSERNYASLMREIAVVSTRRGSVDAGEPRDSFVEVREADHSILWQQAPLDPGEASAILAQIANVVVNSAEARMLSATKSELIGKPNVN
jgi:FkbM family methyltransferase